MKKFNYFSKNAKISITLLLVVTINFILNVLSVFATAPVLTSAAYNVGTGVLTLNGTDFAAVTGSDNDIDPTNLWFTDGVSHSYAVGKTTVKVDKTTGILATVTIAEKERAYLASWMDKTGTASASGYTYKLVTKAGWNGSTSTSDMDGVTVTVSGIPTITSATLNLSTGSLVVTGTNIASQTAADIFPKKISISNGADMYTLTTSTAIERDSATQFTIPLVTKDVQGLMAITNKNGTVSVAGGTYKLLAEAGWNGDTSIADVGANAVTVSNYNAPTAAVTTAAVVIGKTVTTATSTKLGYLYLIPADTDLTDATKSTLDALVTANTAAVATVKTAGANTTIQTKDMVMTTDSVSCGVVAVDSAGALSSLSTGRITLNNLAAPALTVVAAKGAVQGTKLTATPDSSNSIRYKVSSSAIATPKLMTNVTSTTTAITLTSSVSTDITAVDEDTNKYLGVYEVVTATGKVKKFKSFILSSATILGDTVAPTISSATIDGTKKIISVVFSEEIQSNSTSLKSQIQLSTDGTTFADLGASDSAAISGSTLTVTLNSALSTATNKIKVLEGGIKDLSENTNAVATTSAIAAAWAATFTPATTNPARASSFNVVVTSGKDAAGIDLTGALNVKVYSNNVEEGTAGLVSDGNITFTTGGATIPVTLNVTGNQRLTIKIVGITYTSTLSEIVKDITKPTISSVSLNEAKTVATVTFNDTLVDNTAGGAALKAKVQYASDGTTWPAVLAGGDAVALSGNHITVTFATPISGTTGVIRIVANCVADTAGNIQDADQDTSALAASFQATVVAADTSDVTTTTPTSGIACKLKITAAKNSANTSLTGSINVRVVSDNTSEGTAGVVYPTGAVTFTTGAADVPITLTQTGAQRLTVYIADANYSSGIPYSPVALALTVAADAGPTLSSVALDDTKKIATMAFNETIVNNRESIAALKYYTRLSTDGGTTYYGLADEDTVSIAGKMLTVTFNTALSGTTNKIKIAANSLKDPLGNKALEIESSAIGSGWTSDNMTIAAMANRTFVIPITGAKNTAGTALNAVSPIVLITSDNATEGIVYNVATTFTTGAANIPLTLTQTGNQVLTVKIGGVKYQTINVTVSASSALKITSATINAARTNIYITFSEVISDNTRVVTLSTDNQSSWAGTVSSSSIAGNKLTVVCPALTTATNFVRIATGSIKDSTGTSTTGNLTTDVIDGVATAISGTVATVLNTDDKTVVITFNENIQNAGATEAALLSNILLATDGSTFEGSSSATSAKISGATLTVTYATALTGTANVIKIVAGGIKDASENVTAAAITTSAINASTN